MKNWDIEKVVSLLVECGKIALKFYDSPEFELKQDRSIVTIADKTIEAMLADHFDRPADNVYLIGEETVSQKDESYIQNALKETTWIVDPIDGTAPYAHHIPTWGISIGYMKNAKIEEGAIFLPATGEMFITSNNTVYYKACNDGVPSWDFKDMNPIDIVKRKLDDSGLISITQEIAKSHKFDVTNCIQALGCAVFPLVYLCHGRLLAYITGSHLKLWDYAAGIAILKKCGFSAKFLNGKDMTLNIFDDCKTHESGIKRWEIKEMALFTPNYDTFDFLKNKINLL